MRLHCVLVPHFNLDLVRRGTFDGITSWRQVDSVLHHGPLKAQLVVAISECSISCCDWLLLFVVLMLHRVFAANWICIASRPIPLQRLPPASACCATDAWLSLRNDRFLSGKCRLKLNLAVTRSPKHCCELYTCCYCFFFSFLFRWMLRLCAVCLHHCQRPHPPCASEWPLEVVERRIRRRCCRREVGYVRSCAHAK